MLCLSSKSSSLLGGVICLFYYMLCRNLAKFVSYSFRSTVVNNSLREPYLLQTNSLFTLRLSESQRMFNLDQICPDSATQIWKSSTRALFSAKTRCFNRSEHAIYGNFIINVVIINVVNKKVYIWFWTLLDVDHSSPSTGYELTMWPAPNWLSW